MKKLFLLLALCALFLLAACSSAAVEPTAAPTAEPEPEPDPVVRIELKNPDKTKEFIDAIRCRNGNLNIVCSSVAERDVM